MNSDGVLAGTQVGPYRLESLLGAGGAGAVYRAFDTKLSRSVAVKFLHDEVADARARQRFQREAQMASALNHPHILTVYDVGEHEGRQYLVTEFVDGGTLRDWVQREARPREQVVELLAGVADGLAAAHAAGILHRDIKPENVLITRDGYGKLADFGLAKLERPGSSEATATMTSHGLVVGTISYMSPEQASGLSVDARSDVFSFGVMLYELLAGRRPFHGPTTIEILEAIRQADPGPLPGHVPADLRLMTEKALARNPDERYQSMREFVVDLRRAGRRRTPDTGMPAAAPVRRPRRLAWTMMAVIALGAGAAGWIARWAAFSGPVSPSIVRVLRLTDRVGLEEAPAMSPDGRAVAFITVAGGRRQVAVRLIDSGAELVLTTDDIDHFGPRWSPDSAALIYYTPGAQPGEPGALWETPALPGTARRLVAAIGPGDLSHDGRRLAFIRFEDGAPELAVSARDGSSLRVVSKLPSGSYSNLRWSPDDSRLVHVHEVGGADFGARVVVTNVADGSSRLVADEYLVQGADWKPDGTSLVVSSSRSSLIPYPPVFNLWEIPLDRGQQVQLTFGESSYEFPDVGQQGGVVVSRVRTQSDVWKFPTTGSPADNVRHGQRITRQTGAVQTLTISPDESEVAFLSDTGGHANVWIARVTDGVMRPLTREAHPDVVVAVPFWSPRGDWINFLSNRASPAGDVTLWLARPDGSEQRDLGIAGAWVCWSPDGRWIYYSASNDQGRYGIRKVSVDGGQPVVVRDDDAIGCAIAPDGSLYYARVLRSAGGGWDIEVRVARAEAGPSASLGRVAAARVPASAVNFQMYPSPDGRWLATPLVDGSTTNLWTMSAADGAWRSLTDFGERNVIITRRVAWSRDGRSLYASVADVDSDVVVLQGLWPRPSVPEPWFVR